MASPLGPIVLEADRAGQLTAVRFTDSREPRDAGAAADTRHGDTLVLDAQRAGQRGLDDAVTQIAEYFGGGRRHFDLDVSFEGTAFQQRVWGALREIPYGAIVSYGQLAERIGRPGAARAVGHANGRNPIPIVVPCHRVIGSNGALTGYGGGLEAKRFLLDFEAGRRSRPGDSATDADGARRATS